MALAPHPNSTSIKRISYLLLNFLLFISLTSIFTSCGSGGDKGGGSSGDNGNGSSKPSAPTQAPSITVNGEDVTATWTAESGTHYYITRSTSENGSITKSGLLNTSPSTFKVYESNMYYFRLVKVVNSTESDPGPYEMAPVLSTPNVNLVLAKADSTRFRLINSDSRATATSLYFGTTTEVTPTNWTGVGSFPNGSFNELTHTITQFTDNDDEPLTYRYVARSVYATTGNPEKSVSKITSAFLTTAGLAKYRLFENSSSEFQPIIPDTNQYNKADGGLFEVVGNRVYWLCQNGVCYSNVVPENTTTNPTKANGMGAAITFSVDADASPDLLIYFIKNGSNGNKQPWRFKKGATFENKELADTTEDAIAILEGNNYMYFTTDTSIYQIAKTAIEDEPPYRKVLITGKTGIRAPVIGEGNLYYGDSTGVHYITVPDGVTVHDISTPSEFGTISSIAANGTDVYYIANNTTPTIHSGQAIYKVAGGSISVLKSYLFNASNLIYHNNKLTWMDNSKLYTMSASGGTVEGRVSPKVLGYAIADGVNDIIFTMDDTSQRYVYTIPTGYKFNTPGVPSVTETMTLTPGDSKLSASWSKVNKAEAYEIYKGSSFYGANSATSYTVHNLVNGTAAQIKVAPVNIAGLGTEKTATQTPNISWYNSHGFNVDSDDGKIIISGYLSFPYDQKGGTYLPRSIKFHVYRGNDSSFATLLGVPIEATSDGVNNYNSFTIEDLDPTNDGTFYYYNVKVSDVSFDGAIVTPATSSDFLYASGDLPYSNAAKSVVNQNHGSEHKKYRTTATSQKLYWVLTIDGVADPGYRADATSDSLFPDINDWNVLTSDGTKLYGGINTLKWISDPDSSPDLKNFTNYTNQGYLTSIEYSNGWIFVTTSEGIVKKISSDDSTAEILLKNHSTTDTVGNLTLSNGKVYWTKHNEIWAVDETGDTPALQYTSDENYPITELAVSQSHYYWRRTYFRQIVTAPLSETSGHRTEIGYGVAVVYDPNTNRVYWDAGDIFTFDGNGKHQVVCSRPPLTDPNGNYKTLKFMNGKLYSSGLGNLVQCDL